MYERLRDFPLNLAGVAPCSLFLFYSYRKYTLTFKCLDCKYTFEFDNWNDPTTTSGSCKCCGSRKWKIYDDGGNSLC